ncbi:MAG: APC family permease [Gemmataceae bacterium]
MFPRNLHLHLSREGFAVGDTPPISPTDRASHGLLTVFGPAFGVAVVVGGCIGVGILRQPGTVAKQLPDPAWCLLAWLAGGIYVLLGAVSVAELAAMMPKSGAWYVYTRRALGEYAGFVTGWGHWLGLCSGAAYIYLLLANYVVDFFPQLQGFTLAIAVCTTIGLAMIHWDNVHSAGRIQEVTTLVKGLAFLALVGAFALLGDGTGCREQSAREAPAGWLLLGAAVFAFQAILQTYDGWEGAIYFGEEVRDPGRNLPRSIILGTLAVVILYLLVNAALLMVLPVDRIAGHDMAVALAAGTVFESAAGGKIVFALATISILVSCNAGTMQTPRVLFAMSRDRLFFPQAARVNAGGTPAVSLALTTAAIVFFLVTGTIDELLGVLSFFLVANYAMVYVSLFVLRWKEPDAPRPFRAWGYPAVPGVALLGSLVYLGSTIWADPVNSVKAAALLGASVPLYFGVRAVRRSGPVT